MIDTFTLDEFMDVVQQWSDQPIRKEVKWGEYVIILPLDQLAVIRIRSSIGLDGVSASTGENSIRLFLTTPDDQLLAQTGDLFINRTPGWAVRLKGAVDTLKDIRAQSGDCPKCVRPYDVFVSHTAKNPNRKFAKCKTCGAFNWLDTNVPVILKPFGVIEQEKKGLLAMDEKELVAKVAEIISVDGDKPAGKSVMDVLDDLDEEPIPMTIQVSGYEPNEEQKPVIESPVIGSWRLLAGPGSGKTFVLARRYVHLVLNGVSPSQIVAVTFGNKAAGELKDRIFKLMPQLEQTDADKLITTIHAFCFRQGKAYGLFRSDVQVAEGKDKDGKSQFWKLRRIVENAILEIYDGDKNSPQWKEAIEWIQTAKHEGVRPGTPTRIFFGQAGMSPAHADNMTRVRDLVDGRMRNENLLTFTDMVYMVDIALQDDPRFLDHMRSKFTHVLLDEGQDTSRQAMRILSTLADNFSIVGDIDQLLYRFAGATPEANLLDGFEERFPWGRLFYLVRNHRSDQQVVLASQMIRNNYDDWGGPYEARYLKHLQAVRESIGQVHHIETDSALDDAFQAAEIIMQHAQGNITPEIAEQFFLAVRVRAYSVFLEDALAKAAIPFINATGMSFWSQPHIQKVISFLKVAYNSEDSDAWEQIYQIPSKDWTISWRGNPLDGQYRPTHMLKREFLTDFPTFARLLNTYEYNALDWKTKRPGIDICETMYGLSQALEEGVTAGIRYLKEDVFDKYISAEEGTEAVSDGEGGKLDDIAAMIEISSSFTDLGDFLRYVQSVIEAAQSAAVGDWTGRAVISTIHKLKGLERPYVILCGCSEFDKARAKGVTSLMPHTFTFAEPQSVGVLPVGKGCRLEDERCLFFVAITRAKEGVYILSPKLWKNEPQEPSRFIYEMIDVLEGR